MNKETPQPNPGQQGATNPSGHPGQSTSPDQVTPLSSSPALSEGLASGSPSRGLTEVQTQRSSSHPSASSRLPSKAHGWSKQSKVLVGGGIGVMGLGALVCLLWMTGFLFAKAAYSGPVAVVKKEILKVTVVARGSLESAKNGDITCTVRAALSANKGSQNASNIKELVDNGVKVKKGAIVMKLDDSSLKEALKDQNIQVDNANSEWVTADKTYQIDEIQCKTDEEKAVNALDLARLDLDKYIKGDYVQALADVNGRIETAKSDLDDWKDRAAWSLRMFKKNLMSKVQADADKNREDASRIALDKVQEEKRVLVDYTYKRTIKNLESNLKEADSNLKKTKIQTEATLAKDEASRKTKKSVYDQQLTKQKEYEAEILKCTIRAPQDGLVVYFVPEQAKGGGGTVQSIVAQGEPVREGQKLMQIPDLSAMLVNVKVPEAFVSYLQNEPDSQDKSTWQMCQIRVDAFSNKVLMGHIKTVDNVASQQDWFATDVKNYKTMVSIDEPVLDEKGDPLLKPGMSAEVTIYANESKTAVLVVPVQCVVGSISSGAERKCFVLGPDGQPEMRDIVVGMSNERIVEVKSGLKEGDKVVQNPALLIKDTDMKAGKARTKREDDSQDGSSEPGKKDKKGAPGAGKKGPSGPQGVGGLGNDMTPEQKAAAFVERMRSLSPAERRDAINNVPDAFRSAARETLRNANLDVAD